MRAAFGPVVSEALDRSDGIYHRATGALIAQGEPSLPMLVGTISESRYVIPCPAIYEIIWTWTTSGTIPAGNRGREPRPCAGKASGS